MTMTCAINVPVLLHLTVTWHPWIRMIQHHELQTTYADLASAGGCVREQLVTSLRSWHRLCWLKQRQYKRTREKTLLLNIKFLEIEKPWKLIQYKEVMDISVTNICFLISSSKIFLVDIAEKWPVQNNIPIITKVEKSNKFTIEPWRTFSSWIY